MNSDTLDGIKGDIIADPASIESILNNAQVTPPPAKIEAQRADIDRLFASDRYEDILAALKADGSEWADKQITTLATKSPQTIKEIGRAQVRTPVTNAHLVCRLQLEKKHPTHNQ